jgi:UDP-galactopyranose mutase
VQPARVDFDILCFSHLRWDFVYQRPNHLMSRWARERRVFFIEEPIFDAESVRIEVSPREDGLSIVTPHLPEDTPQERWTMLQQALLDTLLQEQNIQQYVGWYYTPLALGFSKHLTPLAVVYDCMDELSAFAKAPPALRAAEAELLARADLVFTGGQSLYEAKRDQHPHVYAFPSSVDVAHFAQARGAVVEPDDQRAIAQPRLGFFGAIDERIDLALLDALAQARPDWQIVMIGPVVKIDPQALPQRPNIHYLGQKPYAELPRYLAGWDVALMPFARNEATRFISPTKTPEYLAAGRPVVSTPIRDVVRPYGAQGLVRIAADAAEFEAAIAAALAEDTQTRQPQVDAFLEQMSWERTWAEMDRLVRGVVAVRSELPAERMNVQQRVVER